jgi:hypothetical protein
MALREMKAVFRKKIEVHSTRAFAQTVGTTSSHGLVLGEVYYPWRESPLLMELMMPVLRPHRWFHQHTLTNPSRKGENYGHCGSGVRV